MQSSHAPVRYSQWNGNSRQQEQPPPPDSRDKAGPPGSIAQAMLCSDSSCCNFQSAGCGCLQYNRVHRTTASMAKPKSNHKPVVLSIAGFDPSSGAGITADIKTIAAHKCYGVSCITALTVQSTRGVLRVDPVEGRTITETVEELAIDFDIAAVKIGIVGSAEAGRAVAAFLRRNRPRHVVLDPVLKSSSGAEMISKDGLEFLKERLLPLAMVITPNIAEAAVLTGL